MSLGSEGLCQVGWSPEASEGPQAAGDSATGVCLSGVWLTYFCACLTSRLNPGLLQLPEPQSLILVTASFSHLRRYLENHLANLFAGAWEPRPEGPLPLDIPQASPQQVNRLSSLVP